MANNSTDMVPVAVLVASCDAYSDIWPAFCAAFQRHWPDCPFPRYFVTNSKTAPSGFDTLSVGPDRSWSSNLLRAVPAIQAEYVLLSVEDLLLKENVVTSEVLETVQWGIEHQVDTLQMVTHELVWARGWGAGRSRCSAFPSNAPYRASTVFTLWRRETLLKVLRPAENAWQFEYFASDRLAPDAKVYLSCESHFRFVNAIFKGKLDPKAVRLCAANEYSLVTKRPTLSKKDLFVLAITRWRALAFRLVPMRHRRVARDFFSRRPTGSDPAPQDAERLP
jgi:hypothetical protein